MIPVRGYDGHRVGVLGLGRSGLATAGALQAGGATPVCWDDNEAARERPKRQGSRSRTSHATGNGMGSFR